jgi:penicillin amidase
MLDAAVVMPSLLPNLAEKAEFSAFSAAVVAGSLPPMSDKMRSSWGALLLVCACGGEPSAPAVPDDGTPLGDALPVDERLALDGLEGPVDAVRDRDGRFHIYATSLADAVLAQGYLVARDRAAQLELLRRVAEGRLTEMLGELDPSLIEVDVGMRHVGLRRTAAEMVALADDDQRRVLDAYASGISQLFARIRAGEHPLSEDLHAVEPEHFTDWNAVDSLAVARLQAWLLSYDADADLSNEALLGDLHAAFDAADPDENVRKRAGIARDYVRFEPPSHAITVPGLDAVGAPPGARETSSSGGAERRAGLARAAQPFARALGRARALLAADGEPGSNNWAVAASRSATGRALLASDPHLSLSSPAVFWPVSLHVEGEDELHAGGIAFPGIPGIILGHNRHVAWGATVSGFDVADVYEETLTADGTAVVYGGQAVALETVEEVIATPTGDVVYPVHIVPHHGPILPTVAGGQVLPLDPAAGALSVRWTGMEASEDLQAILDLLRARSVDEALAALQAFATGSQNWMLADVHGDIGWTTHALVPYRDPRALAWDPDTRDGLLPCRVLPGDGSAEWTGFWPDASVPWAKSPPIGYLATANNDPVGGTLDDDPSDDVQPDGTSGYLACTFDVGFREQRIQQRIEALETVTLDDMSAIQGDAWSPLGDALVPQLLLAIDAAQSESSSPGTRPDLTAVVTDAAYDPSAIAEARILLALWESESGFEAASGIDPSSGEPLALDLVEARAAQATLLFNAWLVRLLPRVLRDETTHAGWPGGTGYDIVSLLHLVSSDPGTLATFDPATSDSALWDDMTTPEIESRQERMIRALLDALAWLAETAGPRDSWRWGAFHTVRFEPQVPLWIALAIPGPGDPIFGDGFPRHGDVFGVDASNFPLRQGAQADITFAYTSGPTQRFVIEMDPAGPRARNALPGGAVWELDHPHFADQAEAWRRNQALDVPFALDDVLGAAEARTLLSPR